MRQILKNSTRLMLLAFASTALLACGDDSVVSTNSGTPNNNNTTGTTKPGDTTGTSGTSTGGTSGTSTGGQTATTNPLDLVDTDGDGLSDGEEMRLGSDPNKSDSDGDGVNDGNEKLVGSDPTKEDKSCALIKQTADVQAKPVDIIFVIDNSGSMRAEIESVERNINENFSNIIRASGLDYRVIMIASHRQTNRQTTFVCVTSPLSGVDCSTNPERPVLTEQFKHYSERISSTNSLQKILDTYGAPDDLGLAPQGWGAWLRKDAFKIFVEITDDRSRLDPSEFDRQLLQLGDGMFGSPGVRRYIFHSIIGVREKNPSTEAWGPMEDIPGGKCRSAVNDGPQYQVLSKLTGGLRFPVCAVDNYDAVFKEVAQGVIEQARIQCQFAIPTLPDKTSVDPDRAVVEFKPSSSAPIRTIKPVASEAACGTGDGFVIGAQRITLCPQTCMEASSSENGTLNFASGCLEDKPEDKPCVPTSDQESDCDNKIDDNCDGFIDNEDPICIG